MILSESWSAFILIVLELIKATLLILAISFVMRARRARVMELYQAGAPIPRWLGDFQYLDASDLEFHLRFQSVPYRNRGARNLLAWGVICTLLYVAMQFGLSKVDYWSAAKCIAVVAYVVVIGGVYCVADDLHGLQFFLRVILAYTLIAVISVATLLFWMAFCPTYTDGGVVRPDPEAYANQWNETVWEEISLETRAVGPDAFELDLTDSGADYQVHLLDFPFDVASETASMTLTLIADGTTEPYATRHEYNSYVYNHACRLPLIWTTHSGRYVEYEYHYGSADDLIIKVPEEIIIRN